MDLPSASQSVCRTSYRHELTCSHRPGEHCMMAQRSGIQHLESACAMPAACLALAVEFCLGHVQALDNLMAGRTTIVVVRGIV